MKSIGGYVVAAVACAVLGMAAVAAGLLEHRLADAEEAMVSLDFAESVRAYDALEGSLWYADYVPWVAEDALAQVRARRAAVRYWDGDYDALLALTRGQGDGEGDANLLFIAANAMYRMGQERAADPAAMLRAIDDARAAYQTVLRQTGGHADAAFNYEYMMVMRDDLAARSARRGPAAGAPVAVSRPVAVPHTIHGREGGPPPGRTDEEFKVFVPEDRDERSKGTTPGGDQVRQRKG